MHLSPMTSRLVLCAFLLGSQSSFAMDNELTDMSAGRVSPTMPLPDDGSSSSSSVISHAEEEGASSAGGTVGILEQLIGDDEVTLFDDQEGSTNTEEGVPNNVFDDESEAGDLALFNGTAQSYPLHGEEGATECSILEPEVIPLITSPLTRPFDNLEDGVADLVPGMTWSEWWYGLSPERQRVLEAVKVELAALAAMQEGDLSGLLNPSAPGASAMNVVLSELDRPIRDILSAMRIAAREVIRSDLEEREAAASEASEMDPEEADNQSWWILGWFAKKNAEEQAIKEAGGLDRSDEILVMNDLYEEPVRVYSHVEKIQFKLRLEGYLSQGTPVRNWDHPTAEWLINDGFQEEFQKTTIVERVIEASPLTPEVREQETQYEIVNFTYHQVMELFKEEVDAYQAENVHPGHWKLHVFDALKKMMEEAQASDFFYRPMDEELYEFVCRERKAYMMTSNRLEKKTEGYLWPPELLLWLSNNMHLEFCHYLDDPLDQMAIPNALKPYRDLSLHLTQGTPPHEWTEDAWLWFVMHANGRNIEGIEFTEPVYEDYCERHRPLVNDSIE